MVDGAVARAVEPVRLHREQVGEHQPRANSHFRPRHGPRWPLVSRFPARLGGPSLPPQRRLSWSTAIRRLQQRIEKGAPMSERVVLVCDVCDKPAQQSVTFRIGRRSLSQDLCATHLQELVRTSHAPRRGRRPAAVSSPAATAAGAGHRRRARTESRASETQAPAKRQRKRITDPATLAKRRAALAKARKALAAKRAAAKKAG